MADDKKERLREILRKNGSATIEVSVNVNEPTEMDRARAAKRVITEMENRRKL